VLGGNLQPRAAPDALHAVLAYPKTTPVKHRRDTPVAVAAILRRQREDPLREQILIGPLDGVVALGAPRLTQNPAGEPLRYSVAADRMPHRFSASLGA